LVVFRRGSGRVERSREGVDRHGGPGRRVGLSPSYQPLLEIVRGGPKRRPPFGRQEFEVLAGAG
jgi:hypothetical protein